MTESTSTTREPVEVHVAGADQPEAARLLLDAAKATGHPVESVATIAGGFLVPYEVAVEAGAVKGEQVTPSETEIAAHPETTGAVTTADGVEHAGVVPASAAVEQQDDVAAAGIEQQQRDQGAGDTEQGEDAEQADDVLRGEALEKALKDRGLSTSGTADEKRARVAAHDAAQS